MGLGAGERRRAFSRLVRRSVARADAVLSSMAYPSRAVASPAVPEGRIPAVDEWESMIGGAAAGDAGSCAEAWFALVRAARAGDARFITGVSGIQNVWNGWTDDPVGWCDVLKRGGFAKSAVVFCDALAAVSRDGAHRWAVNLAMGTGHQPSIDRAGFLGDAVSSKWFVANLLCKGCGGVSGQRSDTPGGRMAGIVGVSCWMAAESPDAWANFVERLARTAGGAGVLRQAMAGTVRNYGDLREDGFVAAAGRAMTSRSFNGDSSAMMFVACKLLEVAQKSGVGPSSMARPEGLFPEELSLAWDAMELAMETPDAPVSARSGTSSGL